MMFQILVQLDSNDLVHGIRWLWLKEELYWMSSAKDRYTPEFSVPACNNYSQKNFMRIIGNDQKNNGQNFWKE